MLTFYYRIWVSLLLQSKKNKKIYDFNVFLGALALIAIANFLNCMLIIFLALLFFKIKVLGFVSDYYLIHPYLCLIFTVLFFAIPNYFLLIFHKKYERLIAKYQREEDKYLGIKYFIISVLLLILFVITTMIFPSFFGLRPR